MTTALDKAESILPPDDLLFVRSLPVSDVLQNKAIVSLAQVFGYDPQNYDFQITNLKTSSDRAQQTLTGILQRLPKADHF